MRVRAQQHGLKLNEYGLTSPGRSVACKTEEDIWRVGLHHHIPPELREDTGEMEAAGVPLARTSAASSTATPPRATAGLAGGDGRGRQGRWG